MTPNDPESRPELRAEMQVGGGRYLLQRHLGEGGMGSVWVAWDREMGKHYALKFLSQGATGDLEHWVRLRQEVVRAQELRNEHIVGFFDLVVVPGEAPFLKMEYVPGRNLDEIRREQPGGVLSWEWLGPLVSQLCDALQHAHDRGIIHCDIKPSNLMVDGFGRLKLADFGIAQMSGPGGSGGVGKVFGTKPYMSPQRLTGEPASPADDIYAVGATVYELLTGQPPFVGDDLTAKILEGTPEPIPERLRRLGVANDVPTKVRQVVLRCLDKETAARPATARDVARALSPAAGVAAPAPARKPLPPPPPPPIPTVIPIPQAHAVQDERSMRGFWVALLLVVAGVAGAILVASHGNRPTGSNRGPKAETTSSGSVSNWNPDQDTTPSTGRPLVRLGTLSIIADDLRVGLASSKTRFQMVILQDGKVVRSDVVDRSVPYTIELPAGEYEVRAAMSTNPGDSWADETELSRRVFLRERNVETVRFRYDLKDLIVRVPEVSGAMLQLRSGGDFKSFAAGVSRKVLPGRKRLSVSAPGYRQVETEVVVPDDGPDRVVVDVAMTRDPTPQARESWVRAAPQDGVMARGPFIWLGIDGHRVWLCGHEVTVGEYAAFAAGRDLTNGMNVVGAEGWTFREDRSWREPGFVQTDQHPVVGVNWYEAVEYCAWLTAKDRAAGLLNAEQRYRLPLAREFEWAARSFRPEAGVGNLAGDEVRSSGIWNPSWEVFPGHSDPFVQTAPVGVSKSQGRSGDAVWSDLIGNVAEWIDDWFLTGMNEEKVRNSSEYFRREVPAETYKVVKGGSWFHEAVDDVDPKVSLRFRPGARHDFIGFRVALEDSRPAVTEPRR